MEDELELFDEGEDEERGDDFVGDDNDGIGGFDRMGILRLDERDFFEPRRLSERSDSSFIVDLGSAVTEDPFSTIGLQRLRVFISKRTLFTLSDWNH